MAERITVSEVLAQILRNQQAMMERFAGIANVDPGIAFPDHWDRTNAIIDRCKESECLLL